MSITMSSNLGRKGRRAGPTSPSASTQSPPTAISPLPKIKLNIRPGNLPRPSSSSSRSRASGSGTQRRDVFSSDSSSDLTPADDDDDEDDEQDDVYPQLVPRKAKKRESLPLVTPPTKDKGKGRAVESPVAGNKATRQESAAPRPSAHGPSGRDRKRHIKLGEVARRRARDDKFGFGGADRFSGATPTQSRITNPAAIDSDSTSSYGDDESEREHTQSLLDGDETEDEFMGGLHEAFAGQEIEDLAYGAGHPDSSMEEEAAWWHETGPDDDEEENDDEEFIAQLTGSDIDGLQSQSSVPASSDDPMSDASSSEDDEIMDEFGFPTTFGSNEVTGSDQPLVLMENWDGQFVLVQPRNDRSRRNRGSASASASGSRTAGSVGESTSLSAGENNLLVDPDADSDDTSDWSGIDDDENDGGDTTDSMCEDDMPVLNSPALDQIVAQQMANGFELDLDFINSLPLPASLIETATALMESSREAQEAALANPAIVITDPSGEGVSPALSTASPASSAPTPAVLPMETVPDLSAAQLPGLAPTPPVPVAPVMGVFSVSDEPCAHAVIDGSKTTTKSPFTRRRRHEPSDSGSVVGSGPTKRRSSRVSSNGGDPFSPAVKKTRYSSIPGHPRYIAARRAAQSLVDPLDRETTPSEEEENAFSLEDMLDASMLPMNELDTSTPQSPELRHLFRFDKVPVSMYMRRNFSSASRNRTAPPTPSQGFPFSPVQRDPPGLTGTLAGPLAHPASRMLISPLLQPSRDDEPMSRKDRRKARKGRMETLQI